MKKRKKLWPWIVILSVFTVLMILDIVLWCTSGSGSSNRPSFSGGSMPEMSTSSGGSVEMPEGFDPGNMSGNFDPNNMPEGFDGSNMPGGFSSGNKSSWMQKLYLPVLIVCIVVDIFALIMLILAIRSNKKNGGDGGYGEGSDGTERRDGENGDGEGDMIRARKAVSGKVIAIVVAVVAVGITITLVILTNRKKASETTVQADESVMEASLEEASMSHKVTAGGTVSLDATEEDYYPAGLEITKYHVSAGDTVAEGDPIADVDRVSVMNTITNIQSVIATLDEKLEDISGDRSAELEVTAAGRVKKIYAEAGRTVVDVVKEQGALMLISLDGKMAVDIETDTVYGVGEKLDVTLGSETLTGNVAAWKEGLITVVIDDEYGMPEDEVNVSRDGQSLGSGKLYIHQALAVTGYEGVIEEIPVAENDVLEKGDCVARLKDEVYSAEYETLLKQREKLQQQMQSMFELYQSGTITAKTSGEVNAVNDNMETVGFMGSGAKAVQLSNSPTGADDTNYVNYAVLVTSVDQDELQVKMSANPIGEIDLTQVGSIGSAICTNAGSVQKSVIRFVYAYNGSEWVQQDVNSIQKGEIVVASFDTDGNLIWIVRAEKQQETDGDKPGKTDGTDKPGEGTEPGKTDGTNKPGKPDETDKPGKTDGTDTPGQTDGTDTPTVPEGTDKPAEGVDPGKPDGTDTPTVPEGTDTPGEGAEPGKTDGTGEGGQEGTQGLPEESGSKDGSGFPGRSDSSGNSGFPGGSGNSGNSDSSGVPGGFSGDTIADAGTIQGMDQDGKSQEIVYAVEEVSVVSITPVDTVSVDVTVDELDISRISEGQTCVITFDAISARSFEGTVSDIDTTGTNDGGNTKYTVTVTLKKEEDMLSGMNTHVTFSYDTKEGAKVIPESALSEEGGKTYVYTGYDSEKDELTGKKEVTTGIADGEKVEILEGLEAEDKVYYRYADQLTIGVAR